MCVAYLAQAEGHRVLLVRLSDRDVPHADTLRNQGWLQSGLRYMHDSDDSRVFARRMRAAGRELHTRLALRPPNGYGILRARNDADAAKYLQRGSELRVPIRRLTGEEARGQLGPLYDSSGVYLAT